MAWAGTGVLWSLNAGVLTSRALAQTTPVQPMLGAPAGTLNFVQISDSISASKKPANMDVDATFRENDFANQRLPVAPEFMLHTGDLKHLPRRRSSTARTDAEGLRTKQVFYVRASTTSSTTTARCIASASARVARAVGLVQLRSEGVHFVGLVNVQGVTEGGLGVDGRGADRLLEKDLAPLSAETPLVVFAHVPLWMVYPKWGWGTDDGTKALALMKRFGSVTVLNGHIHQALQKVEGNMTFHTARSTAFPQPEPGTAPKPGPMVVEATKLKSFLGLTSVSYVENHPTLAIVDSTLASH